MTRSLPAGYETCGECRGTTREVEIEEILNDDGTEVIAEIPHDYGPCEVCDGLGYLPADPAETARAAQRAEHRRAMDEHLRGGVHGARLCPPGCPIELDMYKEHRRPGGVHDTHCTETCIGY